MTTLYAPQTAPFRAMVSSPDPATLGNGEWAKAFNVRQRRGSLVVRWGHVKKTASVPVAEAQYRGHWAGKLGGTEYAFVAFAVFSGGVYQNTRVYRLDLATFAWTEITNPANLPFGALRLSVDGDVSMAPVRDTYSGKDVLVISSGTADYPRVYDPSDATDFAVGVIKPSEYPNNNRAPVTYGITARFLNCFLTSSDFAGFTVTVSDADMTVTRVTDYTGWGTAKGRIRVTATNADVNDTASFIWPTGQSIDATNLSYLTLGISTNNDLWDTALKLEFYDRTGTTWRTFYDSSDTKLNQVVVVPETELSFGGNTATLVQFPLTGFSSDQRDSIGGIRVTVKDATISTFVFDVWLLLVTAATPGNTQFAMTYYNPHTFTESAGMVLTKGQAPKYSTLGGPTASNRRLPEVTGMYYTYQVQTQNPTQAMADNGYEQVRIYERRPGEQEFTLTTFFVTAVFNDISDTWYVTGGASLVTSTTIDTYDYLFRASSRFDVRMPTAYNTCVPRGAVLFSINERLFVGKVNGAASELWISDYQNPMRFSPVLRFLDSGELDDLSPVKLSFEGETVVGMARLTGTVFGQSACVLFTDRSTVPINGRSASNLLARSRIGNNGCIHRGTIAVNDDVVYFIDNDLQLRAIQGGSQTQPLTLNRQDDRLKAGVYTRPAAYATDSQYQMAFRGKTLEGIADTLNKESLVADLEESSITFDRLGEGDFAGFLLSNGSNGTVRYGITSEGHVYELEVVSQETDGTTAFQTYLESPEIHNAQWSDILVDNVGMHLGKNAAGTLNLTVSCDLFLPAKNETVTGTMNFASAVSPNRSALRYAHRTNKSVMLGAEGTSVQIRVYGNIPGGTRIRSIVAQVTPVHEGHDGSRP